MSERRVEHGEKHPIVEQLQQSIADLEENIDTEVTGILNSMQHELQMRQRRKAELDATIERKEKELARQRQQNNKRQMTSLTIY